MKALLGTKIGMTQILSEDGTATPVTLIQAGPVTVTQVKSLEKDGYNAVQVAFGSGKNLSKAVAGHVKASKTSPKYIREFRVEELTDDLSIGSQIDVSAFALGDVVDATGTSKGKGFQGVVKRHGFSGVGEATHGQHNRLRAPGSLGASSWPSRVFKGMRMGGRMGGDRVTVQNLQVIKVIPDHNLILIKGSVPGAKGSIVIIEK